jgi:hypothetical protein
MYIRLVCDGNMLHVTRNKKTLLLFSPMANNNEIQNVTKFILNVTNSAAKQDLH